MGRAVFAVFEFVADDGHLAVEVLLRDEGIDHAIRLQIERPLQVFLGGLKGLEIVRAIERRGAVGARTVVLQFLRHVGVVGRALEHEVFEQMGHPGFTVIFVARADQVDDVDRDVGLRGIGEKQHAQAVGQAVLVDSFDAGDVLHVGRQGNRRWLAETQGRKQQGEDQDQNRNAAITSNRAGRTEDERGKHVHND